MALNVTDPFARMWIEENREGKDWADRIGIEEDDLFFVPEKACNADSPRPILEIIDPVEGASLTSRPLTIVGRAGGTDNFDRWGLEYGLGFNPGSWPDIRASSSEHSSPTTLAEWSLEGVPNGPITIRLTVHSTMGGKASVVVHLNVSLPAPSPTPTPIPSETPTITPTVTSTPTPTATPTASETPTPTP
jgi:hypothetical protein